MVEAYTDDANVGTTTTSIKSYLQGFYNNPPAGYNAQSFVLIVGDVAQIPTFSGTAGSHYTDLYYCEYTGDIFPECYYGRFSAENLTELQPQIDKTLEYEQYLMPDPSFLDEVVMAAGDDSSHELTWGNGQINYGTTNYFNLAHGITSHTYLQDEPSGGNYSQLIRGNVSDGVAYANYTAHCGPSGWANPSFGTSDIPALSNAHKYPLMVGNCCQSNTFYADDCFGEELLMAVDKGALGYIGGSNNTFWDEDYWWGVGYEAISANPVYNAGNLGAYDRTFHDQGEALSEWYHTQGQMPSAGNLAVTQSGASGENYYWEIYHLMGDPSVMIYMSQPPVTNATYASLMPLGSITFTVNTDPYAYVAISKDGVLYGAAVADASGEAIVDLAPINTPGTADVVVTRQNGQPFIGTVTVASPSGPYLSFESYDIDDQAGNNNGLADYDESVALDIGIENLGSDAAVNVSATISSSDTYVSLTDTYQTWPDIPTGTTSTQLAAFAFDVADDVPDQHNASFEMEMTDGSETWDATFSVVLNAPVLEPANNLVIDDAIGGNGNGRLDPGETADIGILISNNGHSGSPDVSTVLTSGSSWVTINSGIDDLGAIPYGSSVTAEFNITCDGATPIGTSMDFNLGATAGNYGFTQAYNESVGLNLEDWETGDFTRYPWVTTENADWALTTVDPYEGVYSAQSGDINDNEVSTLSVTLETTTDDDISFYYKVSSESGYDYLEFHMDGNLVERWAGTVAWTEYSHLVTAGLHTFSWVYDKDGSVSTGSDCGWIDYIVFPPLASIEPDIAVNPAYIDFGDVVVGEEATETFTISNNGAYNLLGSLTAPTDFEVAELINKSQKTSGKNTLAFSISPGGSQDFVLTFSPQNYICYNDYLLINSNDPDEPAINYPVSGCGVEGAHINYNPGFFDKSLASGQTTSDILMIENIGGLGLDYTATVMYADKNKDVVLTENFDSGIPAEWTIIDGGATTDTWFGTTDHSGSTLDETPFAFVNSDAASYNDMDETLISPIFNTDGYTNLTLEFDQYFYYYSSGGAEKAEVDIWDGTSWVNVLSMTTQSVGSWTTPDHQAIDILAYANPDMKVRFHYYDANYDWYWAVDNVSVSGTPGPTGSWLTLNGVNSVSGSIDSFDSENITVGFDASGLENGVFYADIYINSNDVINPMETVPVSLTIGNGYLVDLTVILSGAYQNGEMTTETSALPDFPFSQPFNVAPWNYGGGENIAALPNADIVDWVLVELRDAPSAANANSSTIIDRQAGFLLKDGSVVGTDGSSELFFGPAISNNLFVVVYHKNHLGILSENPLTNAAGVYSYDYTTNINMVHGGSFGYMQILPGVCGMAGGDADCNGNIGLSDLNPLWKPAAGNSGYLSTDFNLDGQIDNKDKDDCWIKGNGKVSQIP
ncbi:MAG: hypothetical protein DRJ05_04765 [Bacteroidetes bacterium]|nr:MAG: hypothetical protein DRJ05_04765 [Bacteroidota bacterium]